MAETAMTVREVAVYLNVNQKTVYRLAQKGEIPGFKVAGTWRFRREDIDRWIERQMQAAAGRDERDEESSRSIGGGRGRQGRKKS
jgi:excisionase family DNA binding protein